MEMACVNVGLAAEDLAVMTAKDDLLSVVVNELFVMSIPSVHLTEA